MGQAEAYFQLPKILGRPQPPNDSAIGNGDCGQKKLYAGSRGRPAEKFAILNKICIFCISFIDYRFEPHGIMPPRLVLFCRAFIEDETLVFVCRHIEPSYVPPNDGGSAEGWQNLRFIPCQIF